MIAPIVTAASEPVLHILHLEDSLIDHRLTRATLRRAGMAFNMAHADTLEAFMQQVLTEKFDVILADYRLPGFTALDAWQQVAQQKTHPPFILLSGAIGEAAAVDAIRLGMADYVLKDDMVRLPHVIERACEVHQARLARERAIADLAKARLSKNALPLRAKSMTILAAHSPPFALTWRGLRATPHKRKCASTPKRPRRCCNTP